MTAPSGFQRLLTHIEEAAPPYGGRGETALAAAVLPLAFVYKVLDCLYGKPPLPAQSWPYILILSAFTAVAFSSVLFLATPAGERGVRRLLAANGVPWLAALPVLYVGLFLLVVWGAGFPELHSHVLSKITEPFSRLSLPLFLPLAGALLYGCFFGGIKLAARGAAAAKVPKSFGWRDLGSVLLAILPFLVLQEQLPLLWCFTTPAAVVVMVYATGLGREYFCYSFVPRSAREALWVVLLLVLGLLLFLLTSQLAGQIRYTGALWRTSWKQVYDAVFVWLLIVGISEEVIFRCGLLTLTAAYFARRGASGLFGPLFGARPRLGAVVFTSLLFGAAHFPHGFFFSYLALLAGLLYGLSFVAGKSLFGPVLLHGMLNVLVLMNFRLPG